MRYRVITAILARLSLRQHPCRGGRYGTGGSLPLLDAGKGPRRLTGGNSHALGAVPGGSGTARAPYRLGLRPPSPVPLRRDERSQGLPCPRAPPGTVGSGGRSHTVSRTPEPAPFSSAVPVPS